MVFPGGAVVRNLPAIPGGARDTCSIPLSRRSPEGGNGNPFQCSCLEIPMDRGAWVGLSPWGHRESDMTERQHTQRNIETYLASEDIFITKD